METKVMTITPEMAKRILEKNKENRKILPARVKYFANQMLADNWMLTGQGLSFSTDGDLIDGQHRLLAVVLSNKSIPFLIITGIEKNTFRVYDDGKSRNANDLLNSKKVKNATHISSGILKYFYLKNNQQIRSGLSKINQNISNSMVFDEYFDNPKLYDELAEFSVKLYANYSLYSPSEMIGFMTYINKETVYDLSAAKDYLSELHGLKESSFLFIDSLRKFILRKKISRMSGLTYDKTHIFKMLIKGWKFYKNGRNVKNINVRYDEIVNI
jgi:hypothetical protein